MNVSPAAAETLGLDPFAGHGVVVTAISGGYAANLGTIAALVVKPDVVYSDRLNHACLIDGCRLSGAWVRVHPHNDAP